MDKIRNYVERAPLAVSGNGGHATTLRVARSLFNGFNLSREEVVGWLRVYNSRLSDKWSDRELEYKAESAETGSYDKPSGWMLATDATGFVYTPPARDVVVIREKTPPVGVNKGEKYVLITDSTYKATLATGFLHTQRSNVRACAHARASQGFGKPVASVADMKGGESPKADKDFNQPVASVAESRKSSSKWDAAVLTGADQPRTMQEHRDFLAAAFEPGDTFDFNNPRDVEEYDRLFPRRQKP